MKRITTKTKDCRQICQKIMDLCDTIDKWWIKSERSIWKIEALGIDISNIFLEEWFIRNGLVKYQYKHTIECVAEYLSILNRSISEHDSWVRMSWQFQKFFNWASSKKDFESERNKYRVKNGFDLYEEYLSKENENPVSFESFNINLKKYDKYLQSNQDEKKLTLQEFNQLKWFKRYDEE